MGVSCFAPLSQGARKGKKDAMGAVGGLDLSS